MRTGPVPTHCMHMRIPRACGFLALPRTSFLPPVSPTVSHSNGPCGRIIRRSSVLTVACCHGGAEGVQAPHNAAGCAEGGTPPASRVGTVRSDAPCRSMRCRGAMMPTNVARYRGIWSRWLLRCLSASCNAAECGNDERGRCVHDARCRRMGGYATREGDACVARWCNMLWRTTPVSRLRRAMVWGRWMWTLHAQQCCKMRRKLVIVSSPASHAAVTWADE